jgi:hypothetical protein
MAYTQTAAHRRAWNKGKIGGPEGPAQAERHLRAPSPARMENRVRELAVFNLGIDSKLRGCDLVKLRVRDVCHGDQVATRTIVMQQKTQRPVQFEINGVDAGDAPSLDQAGRPAIRRLPLPQPNP